MGLPVTPYVMAPPWRPASAQTPFGQQAVAQNPFAPQGTTLPLTRDVVPAQPLVTAPALLPADPAVGRRLNLLA